MSPKGHALLSASSSDRWLHCPPSARLCESYDDKGSDYAAEGTDAHALCEYKLRQALGMEATDPTENLTWFNEEMSDCATGYATYIHEQVEAAKQTCADPVVLIEQRVAFSRWVEGGFGTADCIIIADGTLQIIDYKYGLGVLVSAKENPQIPATNLQTKGDSITFSTPTIEGTVMRRNKVDGMGKHPWKAEVTESGAGVSSSTITGWFTEVYELIAALPTIILAIVDFIIGSIPQIIEAGIQLLTSLISALPTIITTVVAAIPKIIDGVISAVIGAIPLIIEAGIKLLVSLIQALPQIIVTVVKAIPQIVSGLVDAIIGNIDKIIMAGVQLFVALIENLPTIIVEIVKAIPKIITGIVEAIGSLAWKLVEAGGNLIKGLWQGISNAADWIWGKIKGFFSGIVDGIKNFFGIRSPSTLFAGLGRNMGEGIGVGFEDAMDTVARDMRDAIPTQFDTDIGLNMNGRLSTRDFSSTRIT